MIRHTRYGWTIWHVLAAAALVVVGVVITREAWNDMVQYALHDEESSHVLLVPVVFGWIMWVRRERLRNCVPGGRMLGVLFLALGWLLHSVGYRCAIQVFWQFGAVLFVVGCLVTALGNDIVRLFLPAFGALVFLVPIPALGRQSIALPLQTLTASVTQNMCELLGMAVGRDGNLLSVNGNDIAIVDACNGMRMVFTLIYVSYTFAFITPLSWYVRAIILILSPIMAVACNVIRLVPTVFVYGHYSVTFADVFHDVSGWIMLVIAFLLLVGVLRVLKWAMIPVHPYYLATSR